jgi:hypothetical protein
MFARVAVHLILPFVIRLYMRTKTPPIATAAVRGQRVITSVDAPATEVVFERDISTLGTTSAMAVAPMTNAIILIIILPGSIKTPTLFVCLLS